MSETNLLDRASGWAGVAGVIGGIALACAYLLHPPSAPPATVASTFWIWIHVGFMISLVSGIFLLVALLRYYLRSGGGMTGLVGFIFAVTSLVFVFGLDYARFSYFPRSPSSSLRLWRLMAMGR